MNYWLLLIPLVSAFTGWIVIKMALQLLFRPIRAVHVLGFTVQGAFSKHQHTIALKTGKLVAAEFGAFEGLDQKISDPKNMEKIKPVIETHIDDFLRNKLPQQMPMIAMFIGDKTITTLKGIFMQELETLFPEVMQQFAGNLKADLNIEQVVVSKIDAISPQIIESLIRRNLAGEFNKAALLGTFVGLLTGIIQLVIVLLTN